MTCTCKLKVALLLQAAESKKPDEPSKGKIEEVLVKLVRLVANLSISEDIGPVLASNQLCVTLLLQILGNYHCSSFYPCYISFARYFLVGTTTAELKNCSKCLCNGCMQRQHKSPDNSMIAILKRCQYKILINNMRGIGVTTKLAVPLASPIQLD